MLRREGSVGGETVFWEMKLEDSGRLSFRSAVATRVDCLSLDEVTVLRQALSDADRSLRTIRCAEPGPTRHTAVALDVETRYRDCSSGVPSEELLELLFRLKHRAEHGEWPPALESWGPGIFT